MTEDLMEEPDLMLVRIGGALDSEDCRALKSSGRSTGNKRRGLFGLVPVVLMGQTDGAMVGDGAGTRHRGRYENGPLGGRGRA